MVSVLFSNCPLHSAISLSMLQSYRWRAKWPRKKRRNPRSSPALYSWKSWVKVEWDSAYVPLPSTGKVCFILSSCVIFACTYPYFAFPVELLSLFHKRYLQVRVKLKWMSETPPRPYSHSKKVRILQTFLTDYTTNWPVLNQAFCRRRKLFLLCDMQNRL